VTAYYNEHDPVAAAWLRELIRDGLIAPGEVDERSIEDVTPDELRPFQQCHFFAGIGVWSLAARRAGIPDDAPLWSGSCPCQPFSPAGKGKKFADERHLWPAFHYLIEQSRPTLVVGEQVAGDDGDAWLDLVSADLDATGYAFGAAETVAAGFGAPHKRSRNYWMAHCIGAGLEGLGRDGDDRDQPGRIGAEPGRSVTARGISGELADHHRNRQRTTGSAGRDEPERHAQSGGAIRQLDNSERDGRGPGRDYHGGHVRNELDATREQRPRRIDRPGPTNGYWRDADWLRCRDERWRPVESSPLVMADDRTIRDILAGGGRESDAFTFPLCEAGTYRNRVGLLRGAGNAITLGQAEGFLRAVMASL
jgi:DNA (cytosine-5)-methyltransferase 1